MLTKLIEFARLYLIAHGYKKLLFTILMFGIGIFFRTIANDAVYEIRLLTYYFPDVWKKLLLLTLGAILHSE